MAPQKPKGGRCPLACPPRLLYFPTGLHACLAVFPPAQEPWGPEKDTQKALDVQPEEPSLQVMLAKGCALKPNDTRG